MLIFLVGYMGCGKSTIGRALARRLGKPLLDMDALIEEHCGKRVGEIFETLGEDGFRRMERDTLAEVISSYDDAVVATGGGTPCFFDNMEAMNRAGRTIYFQMSAEKLAARLEHGRAKRPLLRDKSEDELVEYIRENIRRREPFYSQARLVIGCDGVSDDYVVSPRLYLEHCEADEAAPGPLMPEMCAGHRLPDGCIGCSAARRKARVESRHGLRDSSVFPGCRSGAIFPGE
ncbi:MAG: shikimate kinase [Alistipes sp.]